VKMAAVTACRREASSRITATLISMLVQVTPEEWRHKAPLAAMVEPAYPSDEMIRMVSIKLGSMIGHNGSIEDGLVEVLIWQR